MKKLIHGNPFLSCLLLVAVFAICGQLVTAQVDDAANGETDPIKLFERGQDAHAKGDYKVALEGFNRAVKLRPDWSMAYSNFGSQLESFARNETDRLAEPILRRAIELNRN